MNVNTEMMQRYADFLEDKSRQIIALCNALNTNLSVARQCMDQSSGQNAATRMNQNIENIKRSVPVADSAAKRLVLSKKHVIGATQVFGGR